MSSNGFVIAGSDNAHRAIARIADHISGVLTKRSSHIDAAQDLLSDLERRALGKCAAERRARLLAIVGTVFGNYQLELVWVKH
jgi:hypothetical protein